jgi:hypothetical protein
MGGLGGDFSPAAAFWGLLPVFFDAGFLVALPPGLAFYSMLFPTV